MAMRAGFVGGLFDFLLAEVAVEDRSKPIVLSGETYWPHTGVVVGRNPDIDAYYFWDGEFAENAYVRLIVSGCSIDSITK
jgi:hypothetical protein